ncbi:hypothetical protein [Arundinibacter roseus]|uniref:Uncharacterized protein n=1 Tax=Arundinibacter roseus TaxID=2070510 RepID=A0A4R4K8M8_9BACT|nr:hypothetical protein [Arundinibacter roseus]TDB64067.1 hypothetical protein EZE20_14080 [Arundinibacter roseus]
MIVPPDFFSQSKALYLFCWLLLTVNAGHAQKIKSKTLPEWSADSISGKVNKGYSLGVSLGSTVVFNPLYEAVISPIDSRLYLNRMKQSAFLMSTVLAMPLSKGELGGSYFRKYDESGKPFGPVYYIPYGLYLVATVNLTAFHDAMNGGVFNQRIDGGLGLGYRINHDLMVSLTYEKLSIRQPRDFLFDYQNQVITINGQPLTTLDTTDGGFFKTEYFGTMAIKIVYLFGKKS